MTSLRIPLRRYPIPPWLGIKISRCERHTLYRSALFIHAHVDKAFAELSWCAIAGEAASIVIGPRVNADEAKCILDGDAKYARVWPSGVIQGHITVFWWHSVSNTSLEMMRADEHIYACSFAAALYIRIIHSRVSLTLQRSQVPRWHPPTFERRSVFPCQLEIYTRNISSL